MSFALVDVNNFYASCERVFNPSLAGRVVVVLSNNDGCVIARSAEAKKLGIPMAMPYFQAEKLLRQHGGVALSSNYELYADMSNRVMSILARYSPAQEVYSIDECFLGMEGFSDRFKRGQRIREQVLRWTGLPVCVGFGATKTLAKLANHCAKKGLAGCDGVCDLIDQSQAEQDALFARIEVGDVWGVGRRIARKLEGLHIHTVRDLRDADPSFIRRQFSVVLERTVQELRGLSCLALEDVIPAKQQIMCSRSFGQPVVDEQDLREAVSSYASRAAAKLRQQGSVASAVHVYLQTNPFKPQEKQYSQGLTLPFRAPTADTLRIVRAATAALTQLFRPGYRYKKAGVMLVGIQKGTEQACGLFDTGKEKSEALMRVMDAINLRNGKGTIRLAGEGSERPWQMRRERMSPRVTTRWGELVQIRNTVF